MSDSKALVVVATDEFTKQQLETFETLPDWVEASKVLEKYKALKIDGIDDLEGFKEVDEARKHVKRVRLAVSKQKDKLVNIGKDFIEQVKVGAQRYIAPLEALEDDLEAKQKPIKDAIAAEKAEKERQEQLRIQEERFIRERNAERRNKLFEKGWLYNGSSFTYILGEAKFVIPEFDLETDSDAQWKQRAMDFMAWKAENTPPPVEEPEPQAETLASQPEIVAPQDSPRPNPVAHPASSGAGPDSVGLPQRPQAVSAPADLGLPTRPGMDTAKPIGFSQPTAYHNGFAAAKAAIVKRLMSEPPLSRVDFKAWIEALQPE